MKFYTVTLQHTHHCNYGYAAIDGWDNRKIYRLSDNEREWIENGEIPEERHFFGVASLNGRIYITGGEESLILYDKQCIIIYLVMIYSNPVCVSIPQLQLAVEFPKSLICIMLEIIIRLLLRMENCIQSEGELRFCISLYEIFSNLDFTDFYMKIFVIQSRNTIRKQINGVKSQKLR